MAMEDCIAAALIIIFLQAYTVFAPDQLWLQELQEGWKEDKEMLKMKNCQHYAKKQGKFMTNLMEQKKEEA